MSRSFRGRELFSVIRPVLRAGTVLLSLVPRALCEIGLSLIRYLPTKLGIALRYMFVARLAGSCGDNVAVFEGVHLFRLANMEIGDNVSIHEMSYIDATGGLKIGANVSIAHATTIVTTDHDYSNPFAAIRDARCVPGPVEIGDDVWVGAGVRILSGTRIHAHSVVAAGAVVTRDVPENSLVAGVPARCVKKIREGIDEPCLAVRS